VDPQLLDAPVSLRARAPPFSCGHDVTKLFDVNSRENFRKLRQTQRHKPAIALGKIIAFRTGYAVVAERNSR
jgi:hypothetical protein